MNKNPILTEDTRALEQALHTVINHISGERNKARYDQGLQANLQRDGKSWQDLQFQVLRGYKTWAQRAYKTMDPTCQRHMADALARHRGGDAELRKYLTDVR